MADKLYMAAADDERTIAYDLLLDGVKQVLTSATVVCTMRNTRTGVETTVSDVTPDPDQATYPGRAVTEFTAAQLAAGVYTLDWASTIGTNIVTYPGNPNDRPILTVWAES